MRRLELKRRIASWALLSVFLPMMVLVSVHHHDQHSGEETACVQCLNHLPHAGHFAAQTVSHGDCVICQFTSLPYLLPAVFVLFTLFNFYIADAPWRPWRVTVTAVGCRLSRAPPVNL